MVFAGFIEIETKSPNMYPSNDFGQQYEKRVAFTDCSQVYILDTQTGNMHMLNYGLVRDLLDGFKKPFRHITQKEAITRLKDSIDEYFTRLDDACEPTDRRRDVFFKQELNALTWLSLMSENDSYTLESKLEKLRGTPQEKYEPTVLPLK